MYCTSLIQFFVHIVLCNKGKSIDQVMYHCAEDVFSVASMYDTTIICSTLHNLLQISE